jgi:PTS system ascorbate-specific IIA component
LVVLSEPVEFGSRENDPVDLVFAFSTTGSEAHVELIQALADFIENSENLEALRRAGTVDEALEVVKQGSQERSGGDA